MPQTCIIVPCYNEEKRLDFSEFENFIVANNDVNFLFCDDGSTDTTLLLLKAFKQRFAERVSIHALTINSGKAEAVRQGIIKAAEQDAYLYIGYWDADLATPLSEINHLKQQLIYNTKDFVMASRMKRLGAHIERRLLRHILGRIFSTFSSNILNLPVYDSQCGAKIFKSELTVLFKQKFITTWLFDVELLARYRNNYGVTSVLDKIMEVPVYAWYEKKGSKIKLSDLIKVPLELLNIHRKYNNKR